MKKSPLAPAKFPELSLVDGVRLAVGGCGMRYEGRDDLLLAEFVEGTSWAGVFTQSGMAAAGVRHARERLEGGGGVRGLMVNAGNANAFTGEGGEGDVARICEGVAGGLGCGAGEVVTASTGVIGERLAVEKVVGAVPGLVGGLTGGGEAGTGDIWERAAMAIHTTDTFAKGATARAEVGGREVRINGIAKGSGMIEPNMATLLVFLFTDAAVGRGRLQEMLGRANEKAFNAISVDGDTSTNDACMIFATGRAGNDGGEGTDFADFERALRGVMVDLAVQVVRDGEGAQKLICVEVCGAGDGGVAKRVAKCVVNSPLVKTAIGGEDANWGRIVMAIGKAGGGVEARGLRIWIGEVLVAENGAGADLGGEEGRLQDYLRGDEVCIRVDLGQGGEGEARVWGCDLSYGYVKINADYRS